MTTTNPLVSVIMPVYNAEAFVAEAINSILAQTYTNFEFIIINDASTDNSGDVILNFVPKDQRIKYLVNTHNLNIAETRNIGVQNAKGKFIMTMDADDVSLPSRIEDQLAYLTTHADVSICIGNIDVMSVEGKFQYTRTYPLDDANLRGKFFFYNPIPNPTTMLRKEVYEKIGKYDKKYVPIDDFDFWLRAGTFFKFGNCGKVILNYRLSQSSNSHTRLRKTEKLTFILRRKALKLGYKIGLKGVLYNVLHLASFMLLPSSAKIWLFNKMRQLKML